MVDFAKSFPDSHIMSQLGDDITVVESDGKTRVVKGVFDFEYEEEELADTLSLKIPYINCTNAVAETLNSTQIIKYNGVSYSIYNRNPVDTGMTQIILRSVRAI